VGGSREGTGTIPEGSAAGAAASESLAACLPARVCIDQCSTCSRVYSRTSAAFRICCHGHGCTPRRATPLGSCGGTPLNACAHPRTNQTASPRRA
jgi:hypothetical protein